MKTQVIQLERYDDVISTRDKLGWSKAPRVVLVFPTRGRILQRKLDLILLIRYARLQAMQIALVTMDPVVRDHATEVGLPFFTSIRQAQRKAWRRPKIRLVARQLNQRPDLKDLRTRVGDSTKQYQIRRDVRIFLFSLAILGVLSVILLFVPSADVTIYPERETQTLNMEIQANPALASPNLAGGVPARVVNVIVESQIEGVPTGRVMVPQEKAGGMVEFVNLTDATLQIPQGTIVSSLDESPIRFETTGIATIPAGVGETASIRVTAIQGGSHGNIEAEEIRTIEGMAGLSATVSNPMAFHGGTDRSSLAPMEADYREVREQLFTTLETLAKEKFSKELGPGDQMISESIQVSEILTETMTPPPGSAADQFVLFIQVNYQGMMIAASDLEQTASLALNALLPADKVPVTEEITMEPIGSARQMGSDTYAWDMKASRVVIPELDLDQIERSLLRQPSEVVKDELMKGIPLQEQPVITCHPKWWRWLPFLPFRLNLEVK